MSASYQCNLCLRIFSTNHSKNIHLSTCRKRVSSLQPAQPQLAQQVQAQVGVNVNITAEWQLTSLRIWGNHTKEDIHHKIDAIYDEIVLWRRNLFMLPSGAAGKKFVSETTKWIEYWKHDVIDFKDIALKVLMVMPAVLLQKPTFKSTSKEHSQCLSRRLTQWESGDFDALLCETCIIQGKLPSNLKHLSEECLAKTFAKLMFEGR